MKNKKGFTLIELLAVIAVIALISMVAIPNIVGLSTGIRKDNMLDDAKKLISLAKYRVNTNYAIRSLTKSGDGCVQGVSCTFTFAQLNSNGDISNDPDGGSYDETLSTVTYSLKDGKETFCIVLIGSHRSIGATGCKLETELYSRSNVVDNE